MGGCQMTITFDDLYPTAEPYFQSADPAHEVVAVERTLPCWRCGRATRWCELNFEAHTCSPECNDDAWRYYFRALGELPHRGHPAGSGVG